MLTHYIVMSSSYSQGKRIALDFIIDEEVDYTKLKNIVRKVTEKCGNDVSISTHFVQTDSKSWNSVIEKDHFFKDVEIVDDLDSFISLIKQDRVLSGLDVAKYILCKVNCTHLKLEKLVYLCFAEYLCKYNKALFEDKIYAYRYGPVVESVYERYKGNGYNEIEKDDEKIIDDATLEMPSRSRIMFAEYGIEKINSIDETIRKYGELTARELVNLTHKDGTPWAVSGKGRRKNEIISNEIIREYHCNEEI